MYSYCMYMYNVCMCTHEHEKCVPIKRVSFIFSDIYSVYNVILNKYLLLFLYLRRYCCMCTVHVHACALYMYMYSICMYMYSTCRLKVVTAKVGCTLSSDKYPFS